MVAIYYRWVWPRLLSPIVRTKTFSCSLVGVCWGSECVSGSHLLKRRGILWKRSSCSVCVNTEVWTVSTPCLVYYLTIMTYEYELCILDRARSGGTAWERRFAYRLPSHPESVNQRNTRGYWWGWWPKKVFLHRRIGWIEGFLALVFFESFVFISM